MRQIEQDPRVLEKSEFAYLQYYLREVDFACQSVSMALSMVADAKLTAGTSTPSVSSQMSQKLSPSALLKASKRIQELHKTPGGDVCVCLGFLFSKKTGSGSSWTSAWPARLKVLTHRQIYSVRAEPVEIEGNESSKKIVLPDQPPREVQQESRDFPISVALDFELSRTSDHDLDRILEENPCLHHGAALSWTKRKRAVTAFDAETSNTFQILSQAEAGASSGSDSALEDDEETDYLFLFDQSASAEPARQMGNRFTPIEFFYVSRLCTVDNRESGARKDMNLKETTASSLSENSEDPTHLLLPDESIERLLSCCRRTGASELHEKVRARRTRRVPLGAPSSPIREQGEEEVLWASPRHEEET